MAFNALSGDRPDVYDAVVMVTDGEAQSPDYEALAEERVNEMRESGIEVFVVVLDAYKEEEENSYEFLRYVYVVVNLWNPHMLAFANFSYEFLR